jgi:hypothetical protein
MRNAAHGFLVRSAVFLAAAAVLNVAYPSEQAGIIVAVILSVLFAPAVWQYRIDR